MEVCSRCENLTAPEPALQKRSAVTGAAKHSSQMLSEQEADKEQAANTGPQDKNRSSIIIRGQGS